MNRNLLPQRSATGGRPLKLTPEVQEKICAAIADLVPYKFAALGAGISYDAWNEWLRRAEDGEEPFVRFRQAVEKAEAEAIQKRLKAIEKAGNAAPQNWMAHAWTLERRYPGDFGRREEPRADGSGVFAELLNRLLAVRQAALGQIVNAQVIEPRLALQMPQDAPQSPTEPVEPTRGEQAIPPPALPVPLFKGIPSPGAPSPTSPSEANLYGFEDCKKPAHKPMSKAKVKLPGTLPNDYSANLERRLVPADGPGAAPDAREAQYQARQAQFRALEQQGWGGGHRGRHPVSEE